MTSPSDKTELIDDGTGQRSGPGLFDVVRRVLTGGHIEAVEDLTPRSKRIRVAGPKLIGLSWRPGDFVRMQVAGVIDSLTRLRVNDLVRSYSVWDADAEQGWVDFVVFEHRTPGSVGEKWAQAARVGDYVVFVRDPRPIRLVSDAAWYLFVGEETAAAGFGSLLRALPDDVPVLGVQQSDTADGHITLPRALTRVERHGGPAAASQQLVDAVAALDLPDEPGVAYLAGEARTIQMVRTHLVSERGWKRRNIVTKPFWTPGKRGMD